MSVGLVTDTDGHGWIGISVSFAIFVVILYCTTYLAWLFLSLQWWALISRLDKRVFFLIYHT